MKGDAEWESVTRKVAGALLQMEITLRSAPLLCPLSLPICPLSLPNKGSS